MREDIEETIKCIETYLDALKMILTQFNSKGFSLKQGGLLYESSIIASKGLDAEMKRLKSQRKSASFYHEQIICSFLKSGWLEHSKGYVKDGLLIDSNILEEMSSKYIELCGVTNVVDALVKGAEEFGDVKAKEKLDEKRCPLCFNKSIGSDNRCGYCKTEYCEFCNGLKLVTLETTAVRDTSKVKECTCKVV